MLNRPPGIPEGPGCYLFRNSRDHVIYVGKARSLSQRLSNYFAPLDSLDFKTAALMVDATSLEWVVTPSDADALLLENELIKTHQPRYNMRLKDDKSFPYLAIDCRSEWPRPYTTRSAHVAGVNYYGPFTHVRYLKRTIDELLQAYPLRSCTNAKFDDHRRRGRPCLLFDVGKCSAPCVGEVDAARYEAMVADFGAFFEGRVDDLRARLEAQMVDASEARDYERAARVRDGLTALESAAAIQRVVLDERTELDAIAVSISGSRGAAAQFRVRHGRVVGRNSVLLDLGIDENAQAILERAVGVFYSESADVPRTVLVSEVASSTLVADALSQIRGSAVTLITPQRGKRRDVLAMADADAAEVLRADSLRREHDHNVRARALEELGRRLGLREPPYRIECFDMSHLQGTNYVGSMVVFDDGLAKKSAYRHFNVRSVLGNDDVGAMHEVVRRRLEHWGENGATSKFHDADLIIIDGGVPQLNAALAARDELGLGDEVQFAALAKREELLYRPGVAEPIALERASESLYLVQRVRDEAHRFAISFHRTKRGRAMVRSVLDDIPGLGPEGERKLMEAFGSLDALRHATLEEIYVAHCVRKAVARAIYDRLHPSGSPRLTKENPVGE